MRPALDFDLLGVSRLRASGKEFERIATVVSGRTVAPKAFAIDESSILPRMREGKVVLIRDAQRELDSKGVVDREILESGIRSILLAPLVFGEEVVGGMLFAKRRPSWYDESDREIVRAIADALVLALQHQRLAEEQQRAAVAEATTQQLEKRVQSLRGALEERFGFDTIQGRSPAFTTALGQAKKVAPTDTTVLLTGASGTGKEVLARAIHQGSTRADGPFVAINCAALPETLIESELFGHERGAFTGADRLKRGRFELAAGGTLFLDEVGELAPAVQAKLLRVLQERSYERVGGTQTLSADVRLLAATNRNLEDAVAGGKFREDLFYRLAVFRVHLPALRERGDDILVLADRFVRELGSRMGKADVGLSREARDLLLAYHWPGNIRELQNAIERAVILSDGGLITAAQLGVTPAAGKVAPAPPPRGWNPARHGGGAGRRRTGRAARDGEAGGGGGAQAREGQQVAGRDRAWTEPNEVLYADATLRTPVRAEAGRRLRAREGPQLTSAQDALAEEDLPHAGLQEHGLEDLEPGEHDVDVAVLQHPSPGARGRIVAAAKVRLVLEEKLRVAWIVRRASAEEPEEHAARTQNPHQLSGQCGGGHRREVVEDIPAQHGVDARRPHGQPPGQERGQQVEPTLMDVPIDVVVEILDVDLATDALAQERDVRADHRAEIHDLGVVRPREQEIEEARERLARVHRLARCGSDRTRLDGHT